MVLCHALQDYVTGWAAGPQPTAGFESCQLLSQVSVQSAVPIHKPLVSR